MEYNSRKNNFGAIRLIAAIMVIVGHTYALIGQNPPETMWNPVQTFGVAIFFCVGGYLVTLSWLRQPDFKQYIVKRIFRIFPALIICILLTVFVIGPLITSLSVKEYFDNPSTYTYLLNCFLYINYALPGVFVNNIGSTAVNGSLWFLPVLFLIYLLVPLYIGIGSRISAKAQKWYYMGVTLFSIVFRGIWVVWFYDTHYVFYGMDFSHIVDVVPYFLMGGLFAVCRLEKYLNLSKAVVVMIGAAACSYFPAPFSDCAGCIFIPYVTLSLALEEKAVFIKMNKIDISYGIFLFSFIIQQILIQIFLHKNWRLDVWILLILSILISVAMGKIVDVFVDKPIGKLRKAMLNKLNEK